MQATLLLLAILLPLFCLGSTEQEYVLPNMQEWGKQLRQRTEPNKTEVDELKQILETHLEKDGKQKKDIYRKIEWNQRELMETIRELNNKMDKVTQLTTFIWLIMFISIVNFVTLIYLINKKE